MKRTYIKQRICHLGGKTKKQEEGFLPILVLVARLLLVSTARTVGGEIFKGLGSKIFRRGKRREEKLFDMPRNNILLQRLQDADNAPRCTKTRTVTKWLSIFCKILKGQ